MKISKKELLSQVNAEGGNITENTFRSLIRYGLILSKKKGHRRGIPLETFYHPSDIEAVRDVLALKQTYITTSWEHMIVLLFLKGRTIHQKKLQLKLVQFVDQMNKNFTFISDNPDKVKDAIFLLSNKLKRNEKPRNRTSEEYEAEQQFELISNMINEISRSEGIPAIYALTFLKRLHIFGLPDLKETFEELFGNFELSKLRRSVLACSESEFHRIQQIFIHSLKLWSEISALYPETKQIPFFGKLLIKLQEVFKTTDLFSKPEFLQLVLISLIHISNKQKMELHEFLLNPTYKRRIILLFRYMRLFSLQSWPIRKKVTR